MKLIVLMIFVLCEFREIVTFETDTIKTAITEKFYPNLGLDWDHYPSVDEINSFLDYLGKDYSDFVSVQVAGYSHEGRPIKIVKVLSGNPSANRIWVDGGIHGREWVAPSGVLLLLLQLVEFRQANTEAIRGVDFYVSPLLNPDGYEYSRKYYKFWRKNRRLTKNGCLGVDLNRNWMYQKAEHSNLRGDMCSEINPGPFPFSEPETLAIKRFLEENRENMKAFLTYHTFGQMIMYPYGYKPELPEDHVDLERVANNIAENITLHGGPQYKVVNTYNYSGFSVGGLDDYAKEVLGIKYTYTVELRDNGTYAFFLPQDLILPASVDAVVAALTVAEEVYRM